VLWPLPQMAYEVEARKVQTECHGDLFWSQRQHRQARLLAILVSDLEKAAEFVEAIA